MAKRKKATKKAVKSAPKHTVPNGFWRQVGAIGLIVFAFMLAVAMFNAGGPMLQSIYQSTMSLIGWAVFVVPIVFIFVAIEIFKAENNRLPFVMRFATIVFIVLVAGFMQMFATDPKSNELAASGQGGGIIGWMVGQGMLAVLGVKSSALVLAVLAFVTSLFVLRVSPKAVFDGFVALIPREDEVARSNKQIAAKIVAADAAVATASAPIGELKLNEGVPTTFSEEPKQSGHSSLKNSFARKPDAPALTDDGHALTTTTDPNWMSPGLELLEKKQSPADAGDVKHNAQIIKDTLAEFNITVEMEGANIGPKVTQYTLKPPSGVKLTR
ncbi:hypothetical protein CYG49_03945, partial [Candidatus Saccharibacteria bacterium]